MSKINTIKKLWKTDKRGLVCAFFDYVVYSGITNIIPDTVFLKLSYYLRFGKYLNLNNPKTFNEKLQWLKLYDRKPEYVSLVDKAKVKEYVVETIGQEYVIPTLGIWDSVEDIDFSSLPNRYVLKCTHDSGSTIVCKDSLNFDKDSAKRKLKKKLKRNMFWWGREWPYKMVKPRIIVEQYIENDCISTNNNVDGISSSSFNSSELTDYKLMCFDGTVKCVFTGTERFSNGLKVTFFDRDWKPLPFRRHYPTSDIEIAKPKHYEKMLELAETLSRNIPFVRVDLYEVGGNILFGEMTFYPGNGMEEFYPEEWDEILGSWIRLQDKR